MTNEQIILFKKCVVRLSDISFSNDEPDDENRNCYLGKYRSEVYKIGETLNEIGGFDAMLSVAQSGDHKFGSFEMAINKREIK